MKDTAATLSREIEKLEGRVMNAPTIESARHFHDRLDAVRLRYAALRCPCCGAPLGGAR